VSNALFEVDREKHEYRYDGRKLISITDCMKTAGIIDNVFASDFDLWVGTATHRAIELYIKGTLKWETLDPSLHPRIEAWVEFETHTGFVATDTEKSIVNPMWGIAGTLDVLGRFPNGKEGIIELKSGNVSRWAGVQSAGQDILLGGPRRLRYGMKVPARGRPSVTPFTDPDDYNAFQAAVIIANWKTK
jgi:hypothetical protein